MKLTGARCLVVGGTRRLGRELAADLVAAGAHVALTSRDGATARRAAEALGGAPHAVGLSADTASEAGARAAVAAAAETLGGLDAVVYAASGAFVPRPPQELEETSWDASFDVVARGFFFTACAARDLMAGRVGDGESGAAATRGVVVAITDLLGLQAWAAFAAHGAAKAAQIHLVKTLARAWAKDGVRVCGVAPGPVDLVDDERRDAALRTAARGPAGRLVSPGQVAGAVRFCLENDAVTGVNVIVDGGALVAS